jgi:hypothetical protein
MADAGSMLAAVVSLRRTVGYRLADSGWAEAITDRHAATARNRAIMIGRDAMQDFPRREELWSVELTGPTKAFISFSTNSKSPRRRDTEEGGYRHILHHVPVTPL